jgi:protein-tyrosine-phosphatase
MLEHLQWNGVAMIEYRKNLATGEFTLMEINGRFWGSLPLAVSAGVDFPYQLYRLLVHNETPPTAPYRIGLFQRNLHKDLGWLKQQAGANRSRIGGFRLLIQQMLIGLKRLLLGKERLDTITLDDPIPGIVETLSALRSLGGRIPAAIRKASFGLLASNRQWRQGQRMRLRRQLHLDPKLLFVCRGNICRSPFAERYARLRFASLGLDKIETLSAGTFPIDKRLPPQLARRVSVEFGVHLDEHRSRVLETDLTKWASAIVCMDLRDYGELRAVFPEIKNKLFLLRPFDVRARDCEIPDPWGKSADAFRSEYYHISLGVEGLIQVLIR